MKYCLLFLYMAFFQLSHADTLKESRLHNDQAVLAFGIDTSFGYFASTEAVLNLDELSAISMGVIFYDKPTLAGLKVGGNTVTMGTLPTEFNFGYTRRFFEKALSVYAGVGFFFGDFFSSGSAGRNLLFDGVLGRIKARCQFGLYECSGEVVYDAPARPLDGFPHRTVWIFRLSSGVRFTSRFGAGVAAEKVTLSTESSGLTVIGDINQWYGLYFRYGLPNGILFNLAGGADVSDCARAQNNGSPGDFYKASVVVPFFVLTAEIGTFWRNLDKGFHLFQVRNLSNPSGPDRDEAIGFFHRFQIGTLAGMFTPAQSRKTKNGSLSLPACNPSFPSSIQQKAWKWRNEMSNIVDATETELDQTDFNRLTWLNSEEAATYLRKTPNALRIMVSRGYIRPRRLRRRLYFRKVELDRMLELN